MPRPAASRGVRSGSRVHAASGQPLTGAGSATGGCRLRSWPSRCPAHRRGRGDRALDHGLRLAQQFESIKILSQPRIQMTPSATASSRRACPRNLDHLAVIRPIARSPVINGFVKPNEPGRTVGVLQGGARRMRVRTARRNSMPDQPRRRPCATPSAPSASSLRQWQPYFSNRMASSNSTIRSLNSCRSFRRARMA